MHDDRRRRRVERLKRLFLALRKLLQDHDEQEDIKNEIAREEVGNKAKKRKINSSWN